MVSAREFIGISNPRTQLYGQWNDTVKEIRVAGGKRVHIPERCPECQAGQLDMSQVMHTLIAAPGMGLRESEPHPLPWLDAKEQLFSELVSTEAVAAYDNARHT